MISRSTSVKPPATKILEYSNNSKTLKKHLSNAKHIGYSNAHLLLQNNIMLYFEFRIKEK